MESARGFPPPPSPPPVHKFDTICDTDLPLKLPFHKMPESKFFLRFRKWQKSTLMKTNEGAADEKYGMAIKYLTVSSDSAN